ncbi:MAG: heavy-metal-associated domain-containing protein [Chloroflexi bacterium]|nr:heavy-metal-associated domain-containing protein [Chloroflexota bacterium]
MTEHTSTSDCHVDLIEKPLDQQALERAQFALLFVQGMGCPTCARRVHNGLLALDGVLAVDVVLERGLAQVLYDPAQINPTALLPAVTNAGNDGRHHYTAQLLGVYARPN